ncbi:glycosyl hydrolase family 88 [Anoxynatronum buryatiense]|uniref:Uncharacterized protein n=1 Tax=Anoxynatronum buryatiense TaxID=489973 RepID=A0AA45WW46_9CLOT|nr:glycosyl hydrolase family 88 [Anoxynatronum buryatiense]SMP56568.1 hypothetical protein SAMN06296020_10681 [Anoxynatronum buryatiense]
MGKKQQLRMEQSAEASKRSRRNRYLLAGFFLVLAAFFAFHGEAADLLQRRQEQKLSQQHLLLFENKVSALAEAVFSEESTSSAFFSDPYGVFFSISDTTSRAAVVNGQGTTLQEAWDAAVANATDLMKTTLMEPVWVKVDVVDHREPLPSEDLQGVLQPYRNEFFRKGIAFDEAFETAFLEAEINGNKLIDYDEKVLSLETIQQYLETFSRPVVDEIPRQLFLFTALGWFCDEAGSVYPLYGYEGNGYDYGRRKVEAFDREVAASVILSATGWLAGEVQEDGAFIYGYYPTYDRQFTAYNLLRHAVSIQPFMWTYDMTGVDTHADAARATLDFLTEDHVVYLRPDTAFIIDRPNDEIKLGGNALAIITLMQYMDTYDTDEYLSLCVYLGNGILELMDEEAGTFYHVLNTDFSPKDAFRTVYYDGESAYALALLYEMTGNDKWLDAARSAVENFIREDYTRHRDHWVAYALNEVTRHDPNQRYYEFALRNVQENLNAIYHRDTSYHTYLELLMASFDLYHRIKENNLQVDYMAHFDEAFFIDTIFHRAEHMLNGFFYPEYSMYLRNPQRINGTFFIRHDGYRVRIDDVEHFIAGYYNFWRHYEALREYQRSFSQ